MKKSLILQANCSEWNEDIEDEICLSSDAEKLWKELMALNKKSKNEEWDS
jgi:hypothetical protein